MPFGRGRRWPGRRMWGGRGSESTGAAASFPQSVLACVTRGSCIVTHGTSLLFALWLIYLPSLRAVTILTEVRKSRLRKSSSNGVDINRKERLRCAMRLQAFRRSIYLF
ncbi:hypothetical protein SORBI_3003G302532 [Sorghum bicolor]|uniref:Uncharacterized protein n=1 Tax=Sorghum bicolor TaxID=4558 RepID=A0A1W0VZL9_SORBI|nr:hypothetical protein SORBI_3003G302532 [Sorghum bicolor]